VKKKIFLFMAVLVCICFPACKASKEDKNKKAQTANEALNKEGVMLNSGIQVRQEVNIPNSPEWINEIPPDDLIYGIGTAKMSSVSMSMTTAELRARAAIFRYINDIATAALRDYFAGGGDASDSAYPAYMESVAMNISNMELSGTRPVKRWQAEDSAWWYLVEYKKSDLRLALAVIFTGLQSEYPQFDALKILGCADAGLAVNNRPLIRNN
jgi:hypothetical protein